MQFVNDNSQKCTCSVHRVSDTIRYHSRFFAHYLALVSSNNPETHFYVSINVFQGCLMDKLFIKKSCEMRILCYNNYVCDIDGVILSFCRHSSLTKGSNAFCYKQKR